MESPWTGVCVGTTNGYVPLVIQISIFALQAFDNLQPTILGMCNGHVSMKMCILMLNVELYITCYFCLKNLDSTHVLDA